jgi:hypothetical protein
MRGPMTNIWRHCAQKRHSVIIAKSTPDCYTVTNRESRHTKFHYFHNSEHCPFPYNILNLLKQWLKILRKNILPNKYTVQHENFISL